MDLVSAVKPGGSAICLIAGLSFVNLQSIDGLLTESAK
jgi:hypothetical protein